MSSRSVVPGLEIPTHGFDVAKFFRNFPQFLQANIRLLPPTMQAAPID